MSVVSKFFGKLASFDITGRTWTREVEHPYFQNLIYFGHKDPLRAYWEAEKTDPTFGEAVGLTMKGTASMVQLQLSKPFARRCCLTQTASTRIAELHLNRSFNNGPGARYRRTGERPSS